MPRKPRVIAVTGPTASGKSTLAVRLARKLRGEIINADSVQVYQGFDIGSAKPDAELLSAVPHHLVSLLKPEDEFNAGIFQREAAAIIEEIGRRGNIPIIAGGTGLYLAALLSGLVSVESDLEPAYAEVSNFEARLLGEGKARREIAAALHQRLAEKDPDTARFLKSSDYSRLRRALAVALSGQSLAKLQAEHRFADQPFDALVLVLWPERVSLYRLIDARVEQMLNEGLIDETESLLSKVSAEVKPMASIGYRHAAEYIMGRVGREQMIDTLKRDTRHFAKRQFTWWRNRPQRLGWIDLGSAPAGTFESITKGDMLAGLLSLPAVETAVDEFLLGTERFVEGGVYYLKLPLA